MLKKFIMFLVLLMSTNIFIIGCSNNSGGPISLSLEQSIKEIITSKGEGYNFLDDEGYMNHMEKLGIELTNNNISPPYSIGNLDDDNIPELAVFKERDSNNIEDEGSLDIYKFNGEEYELLDSISMNFDNTNYQIEIGKIGLDQNGIFLCNQVGAHSGVTYGFILNEGKLKSILNNNKLSLISVYPENEIKDIDGDGILNFSILAIDPETEESNIVDSDKMTLWYKWNGKDSADLVMVQRDNIRKEKSDENLILKAEEFINNNFPNSLEFIHSNKDSFSKDDNTYLLLKYIEKLDELSYNKSIQINNLFTKHQKNNNFNFLFEKYGLNIERLNSIEYLNRDKVLKDEEELKENIIDNIGLGYKLASSEGIYYYVNNYQLLLDLFNENITNEYKDYLDILALDINKAFMNDGNLTISMDELSQRILLVESYEMIYPYSDFLNKVRDIYEQYLYSYFYGDNHNPNFDIDTLIIKADILKEYEKTIEQYEYTNFANIVKEFMESLKENNNVVNDKVRQKLNDILN